MFSGLTEDTYRFFWELAFHNDKTFFEENREQYKQVVYQPLKELTELLSPTIEEIDDRLSTRPASVISHIYRDTRYTKDKSPYRDHAWIGFKMPGSMISENFVLYAEFNRDSYGYGMGMYAPNPEMMAKLRANILAKPEKFISLVSEHQFQQTFQLEGQAYKRPKFTEAPEAVIPYLNYRNISFCFSSENLSNTMKPEIHAEIRDAFLLMKPVYRFLMGLSETV